MGAQSRVHDGRLFTTAVPSQIGRDTLRPFSSRGCEVASAINQGGSGRSFLQTAWPPAQMKATADPHLTTLTDMLFFVTKITRSRSRP